MSGYRWFWFNQVQELFVKLGGLYLRKRSAKDTL